MSNAGCFDMSIFYTDLHKYLVKGRFLLNVKVDTVADKAFFKERNPLASQFLDKIN